MEVAKPLPNTSGFAFTAERMVAWLERSCERGLHKNATCRIKAPGYKGKEVPWILEKLSLMNFGESMARGLFENVGPNEDCNSTLWRSVTRSEDMKVYDSLYKSYANFKVAGGVVTFGVRHSPELVLETHGDEEIHHEVWDVLGGLTKLYTLTKYSTGDDTRNNISASMKLVEGNQPLQEKRQQSIESITFAINQTVGRVKEALEKHQHLLREECDWPTEKQLMQDELRVLKLN
nr:homeobox-leucine zipper protein HDG11-like [Tanacetum cinerariifolium]